MTGRISMAEGNANPHEMSSETFHEIEAECSDAAPGKIALLLKITQPGGRPLPMGVITERSVMALLTDATNYEPLGLTIMNNIDVVAEFGKGVRVFEIAQLLHSIDTWNKYRVEVGTLMSSKEQIVDMVREREQVRQAAKKVSQQHQELIDEETKYRVDIKDLLDRFEEQVKRIELTQSKISSFTGPPSPGRVDTPPGYDDSGSPRTRVFKQLTLPRFSGALPVPKGEGSYDQYMFQLKGFRATYTDDAIKSGMIGSITDDARDYLDFIGFDKELPVLISTLEERYGKGETTNKIQQEFYQLTQDRNEQVQQFAGRLEFRYKKLVTSYPDRYNSNTLKERLFYGMTQHLRDSMRYLYKQPMTTYEQLLASTKEAEAEWLEHKTIRSKATTASQADPGRKEREELKSRIDKLTAELNKREKERQWKKKRTPTNSPRDSPNSKGPGVTAAGPFREGRRPLQCYNCGGWGHMKRECSTQGNVNWEELNRVEPTPSVQEDPESIVLKKP